MISPPSTQIVHVHANGFGSELELDEVMQERSEALYDFLAGRNVFGESHPSSRPIVKVLPAGQLIEQECRSSSLRPGHGVRYRTGFRLPRSDRHGTDYDFKPVLSFFGVRL